MSESKDPKSPQLQCSIPVLPSMKMRKLSFTNPAARYEVCFSGSVDYAGTIEYDDWGNNKGKLLDSIPHRYYLPCSRLLLSDRLLVPVLTCLFCNRHRRILVLALMTTCHCESTPSASLKLGPAWTFELPLSNLGFRVWFLCPSCSIIDANLKNKSS